MKKIKLGDIYEISTAKGNAYLHYIYKDNDIGELIRVLKGIYVKRPNKIEEIIDSGERFMVFFPLSAAVKRKIVEYVGNFPIDKFSRPKYMRTEYNLKGEFIGWHIVETDTWQRQTVKKLKPEQKQYSPWGIWNETLLIEKLEADWSLDNWE